MTVELIKISFDPTISMIKRVGHGLNKAQCQLDFLGLKNPWRKFSLPSQFFSEVSLKVDIRLLEGREYI